MSNPEETSTRKIAAAIAVGVAGIVTSLVLANRPPSDVAESAQSKSSPLVCEFDKAHNKLVIRDTRNNHIAGAMFEAVESTDRSVTGVGGIYPEPGQVGMETGIQFKADFAARSCEAKHHKDSWGREALSAHMSPDLKHYTYTIK